MNKNKLIIILLFTISMLFTGSTAYGKIGIIVNSNLYPAIKTSVETYINDLKEIEGKGVWLNAITFSDTGNKKELKDSLIYHYENDSIEGVVLIGDLPLANFKSIYEPDYDGDGIPDTDIFPCDLYYMDLDGIWAPEELPESHTDDISAEIWISRLTCSVLTHLANLTEAQIISEYFNRVHKRMYGRDNQERTYLIAGMYWEWSSLESENIGDLDYDYGNIETYRSTVDSSYHDSICASQWKKALIDSKEYAYVYSHAGGMAFQHRMGYTIWEIYDDTTDCRFYSVYCCQNSRYTTINMCGAYSTEDQGLVCMGSAKSGSMRFGTYRHYNRPLGQGKNFGEATKNWFNRAGLAGGKENDIPWHYGMTLQGVGTLHLQPYTPVTNQAPIGITLSGQVLVENDTTNPLVGILSTIEPDTGQAHTYSIVNGIGDTDNVSFSIINDSLYADTSFDYETNSSLSIRIRTTDNGTPADYYEKVFTIFITNVNEAPIDITIDKMSVADKIPGAIVGNLAVIDPDTADTHTVSIDDLRFEICAGVLKLKDTISLLYTTEPSVPLAITASDTGNLFFTKHCTLTVLQTVNITGTQTENSQGPVFYTAPNPATKGIDKAVVFCIKSDEKVNTTLRIYDAMGNLIFKNEFSFEGNGKTEWNLRNMQGKSVDRGTYLAILELTDRNHCIKCMKTYISIKEISE